MALSNTDNRTALNKANFEGEPFQARKETGIVYCWGDFGTAGAVSLERRCADNTWQRFPTTTYTEQNAWGVNFTMGEEWRIAVDDCVDVSVEVR